VYLLPQESKLKERLEAMINRLAIYEHSLYTEDALWDIFTERPEFEDHFEENQLPVELPFKLPTSYPKRF